MNIEDILIDNKKEVNIENLDIFKITNMFINRNLENLKFNFLNNEIIEFIKNKIPNSKITNITSGNNNEILLQTKDNMNDKIFISNFSLIDNIKITKIIEKDSFILKKEIELESFLNQSKKITEIRNIIFMINLSESELNNETYKETEILKQKNTFKIKEKISEKINSSEDNGCYQEISLFLEENNKVTNDFLELLEVKYDKINSYAKKIIIDEFNNEKNQNKINNMYINLINSNFNYEIQKNKF